MKLPEEEPHEEPHEGSVSDEQSQLKTTPVCFERQTDVSHKKWARDEKRKTIHSLKQEVIERHESNYTGENTTSGDFDPPSGMFCPSSRS